MVYRYSHVFLFLCIYVPLIQEALCFLQGAGQDRLGIYIKSVVAGGAADAVSLHFKFHFFFVQHFSDKF